MRPLRVFLCPLLLLAAALPCQETARGADMGGAAGDGGPANRDAADRELPDRFIPVPPKPAPPEPAPVPTPLELLDEEAGSAPYGDLFRILKEENSCSRFYGGPSRAVEVLNALTSRLRPQPFADKSICVRMTGTYTSYRNAQTGASYRLFERAAVNSNGPLNTRQPGHAFSDLRVGSFAANTRAARALILLHEMGHLVEGEEGGWLLPDDGYNQARSHGNTATVEKRCYAQLKLL